MAPGPFSKPRRAGYTPLSPYTDDDNALSNNLICPRYADSDPTSAPPSPASIESFDILDSVAWRRGHTSYHDLAGRVKLDHMLCLKGGKKTAVITISILLLLMLIAGSITGGILAIKHHQSGIQEACLKREGGSRCSDSAWAKCVAQNGLGYCEGALES